MPVGHILYDLKMQVGRPSAIVAGHAKLGKHIALLYVLPFAQVHNGPIRQMTIQGIKRMACEPVYQNDDGTVMPRLVVKPKGVYNTIEGCHYMGVQRSPDIGTQVQPPNGRGMFIGPSVSAGTLFLHGYFGWNITIGISFWRGIGLVYQMLRIVQVGIIVNSTMFAIGTNAITGPRTLQLLINIVAESRSIEEHLRSHTPVVGSQVKPNQLIAARIERYHRMKPGMTFQNL